LTDFSHKVDLRKVNKRVIESLIKCGAFDSLHPSRAAALAGLETVLEWAQGLERQSSNPQMGIFGAPPGRGSNGEPRLPDVPDWPETQRLAFEKETMGFYLSGHPLTRHRDLLQRLATTDTQRIWDLADGREAVIGGVVNSLKETTTKKGDRMAFLTLEDLNGVVEVIVFSDLYKKSALALKGDDPLFIKGRIDAGEESVKIIASEVLSLDQAMSQLTTTVHLHLRSDRLEKEDLAAIREIFQDCRGSCSAYLHLLLPGNGEAVISLGDEWKVNSTDRLVSRLRDLLGYEAVQFQA
jgi:DNA polymerase-3 subunit alpha